MIQVVWDKSFEIGIEKIDNQHKKLFEIINKLSASVELGEGEHVYNTLYRDLADYLIEHFGTEEMLMDKWHYPEAESHIAAHNGFVDKVKDFQKKAESGVETVNKEILQYLLDWLIKHIKAVDLEMGEFLVSKGE